jgi:probable selenium-dependent hydroxylase accessory protein YqeC
MGLLASLQVGRGDLVAVAGAGGKTSLVYALAREARAAGLRVVVTTTTHMGTLPEEMTGPVFLESEGDPGPALGRALATVGQATLLGRRVREDKLEGLAPERVDALVTRADLVLVEADGARGRSLKVPAPHEPVVPGRTSLLLVVAALDVLGAPLDEERVHRLDRVLEATRRRAGETVGEDEITACLAYPAGYPSRRPPAARLGAFLNKAEDEGTLAAARRIAARLVPPYAFVAAGSARSGVVAFR